jgi:hypothetical protein
MRKAFLAAAFCGSVMISACATVPAAQPGAELWNRTLQMESRGQTSTLHFMRDGVVHAQFGGQQVAGRWQMENGQLCFYWTGAPRECWPYSQPLQRGQAVSLTSDRGNVVRVTLQ